MDTTDYITNLDDSFKAAQKGLYAPWAVHGDSGNGKTQIPAQWARDKSKELGQKVGCWVIKCGQADSAGDLVGMPESVLTHYPDPEGGYIPAESLGAVAASRDMSLEELEEAIQLTGRAPIRKTRFNTPEGWPQGDDVGVVILDELTRAPSDIANALLGLPVERRFELSGYEVPPGVFVIATANPPSREFHGANDLDRAMKTRMIHFNLTAKEEDVLRFLKGKETAQDGTSRKVVDFLSGQREFIGCKHTPNSITDEPSHAPRVAELMVDFASITDNKDLLYEASRSAWGSQGAEAFLAFLEKAESYVSGSDVLANYAKVQKAFRKDVADGRTDKQKQTLDDVLARIEDHDLPEGAAENLMLWVQDMYNDYAMTFTKRLQRLMRDGDKEESRVRARNLHNHEGLYKTLTALFKQEQAGA